MFVWFKFTKEQRKAMRKKIPMIQQLFDEIMEQRDEIGEEAEDLSWQLMLKYPDFLIDHEKRALADLGIDFDNWEEDIEPEMNDIDSQESYQEFLRKVEETKRKERFRIIHRLKKKIRYVL